MAAAGGWTGLHDCRSVMHIHVHVHEQKPYLVGPDKLSDPWTVLFSTCYLSSGGNMCNLSSTPLVYICTCFAGFIIAAFSFLLSLSSPVYLVCDA